MAVPAPVSHGGALLSTRIAGVLCMCEVPDETLADKELLFVGPSWGMAAPLVRLGRSGRREAVAAPAPAAFTVHPPPVDNLGSDDEENHGSTTASAAAADVTVVVVELPRYATPGEHLLAEMPRGGGYIAFYVPSPVPPARRITIQVKAPPHGLRVLP